MEVSDHAVIRYMERRYGFEVEMVKDEILDQLPSSSAVDALIPIGHGLKAQVRSNRVTTILKPRKRGSQ